MAKPRYRTRVVDTQIQRALRGAGAVVVEGSKACGKTTTAEQIAASKVWLDRDTRLRTVGLADPKTLVDGPAARLIDEWQLVPEVWNAVRAAVDVRGKPGQFILTESATPAEDASRHSGAMRFVRVTMRPMSLFESGQSTGAVSLAALWDGQVPPPSTNAGSLEGVAESACRGGWPGLLGIDLDLALDLNRSYLRTIAAADIVTVDGVRRDPRKVEALLGALGRNTGTYVSNRTLQTDSAAFGQPVDPATVTTYLDALERLWVLAPQHAWGGHMRSNAPARKAPKRHLADPSLAAAAMGAAPVDLLDDHQAFGQVFETLAFRDLSVYAEASGSAIRAFQDAKGNEIDAVVVRGTRWAGFEVKLRANRAGIDNAAAKLLAIAARMTSRPRFLAILTGDGPTYCRADGVHVVSVTELGP
ncbi:MAG: DUF4143 domain-containing protein [Micrococcales bacterium]|nr:DUF4143 domain-containing protein [Micrococcales bacterium]